MKCDDKEWRNIDYSKYDIVITNPPFSQVREFIRYLISIKKDFIIIVSDVLRYSIKENKVNFGINLYKGRDAQKFYRPDGSIKAIHCGWISTVKDDWGENYLIEKKREFNGVDDSCDYLVIRKDDKKLIGMIENVKDNKFTLLNEEQNKGYEDEIIKLIELKKLLYKN